MTILKKNNRNKGMTYLELIVVLGIFSVMASVVLFNYKKFQAKVDIKNLANEIALQIVEAQRSSLAGKLPPATHIPGVSPWKPSYGLFFETPLEDQGVFINFVDLDQDKLYNALSSCPGMECLNQVTITKNNSISDLRAFYPNGTSQDLADLTLSFTRPSSIPTFRSSTSFSGSPSRVEITVSSPSAQAVSSAIRLYSSGRVQINQVSN